MYVEKNGAAHFEILNEAGNVTWQAAPTGR
jgi:hypothetical protein